MGRRNATAVAPHDDWQARSDFDTLMEAHRITNDPKRHKAAKSHAKSRLDAMQKVVGSEQASTKPGK
jgi:hypothetical protein